MTDQTAESVPATLRATFIPDGQVQVVTVAIGTDQGSTVITPKLESDQDGDDLLVLDVVTAVPAAELAELLTMIAEGLRGGTLVEHG